MSAVLCTTLDLLTYTSDVCCFHLLCPGPAPVLDSEPTNIFDTSSTPLAGRKLQQDDNSEDFVMEDALGPSPSMPLFFRRPCYLCMCFGRFVADWVQQTSVCLSVPLGSYSKTVF